MQKATDVIAGVSKDLGLSPTKESTDGIVKEISKGLEKGVSQPLVIFNGYESTYNDHITDNYESNYFYSPLNFRQIILKEYVYILLP
mgnify:CR=1 FL=1